MSEEQCKEKVYPSGQWGAFHSHQCTKPVWKDGYCKVHHPESVKIRRAEQDKRYEERKKNDPFYLLMAAREENVKLKQQLAERFTIAEVEAWLNDDDRIWMYSDERADEINHDVNGLAAFTAKQKGEKA